MTLFRRISRLFAALHMVNKNKKRHDQQHGSNVGGSKNQRNALSVKGEINTQIKGRHRCNCQARIHELVRNCMGCGKIVCTQEGSGPCFCCGHLVCTREEQEILDRGSRKSDELYCQLMGTSGNGKGPLSLASIGADLEKAAAFRDRLLEADADTERRTKVNDLESDYYSIENNPFLMPEERKLITRRREELRELAASRKRAMVVSIGLDGSVTEKPRNTLEFDATRDLLINEILDKSEERRKAAEATHALAVHEQFVPQNFVPIFDASRCSGGTMSVDEMRKMISDCPEVSHEGLLSELERRPVVFSLPQPAATLVAQGHLRFYRWSTEVVSNGPIYLAATAKAADINVGAFVSKFCRNSNHISSDMYDFACASMLGRVFLDDCLTIAEFREEFGNEDVAGDGDWVLSFTTSEPLTSPMPYLAPCNYHEMGKDERNLFQTIFRN